MSLSKEVFKHSIWVTIFKKLQADFKWKYISSEKKEGADGLGWLRSKMSTSTKWAQTVHFMSCHGENYEWKVFLCTNEDRRALKEALIAL